MLRDIFTSISRVSLSRRSPSMNEIKPLERFSRQPSLLVDFEIKGKRKL